MHIYLFDITYIRLQNIHFQIYMDVYTYIYIYYYIVHIYIIILCIYIYMYIKSYIYIYMYIISDIQHQVSYVYKYNVSIINSSLFDACHRHQHIQPGLNWGNFQNPKSQKSGCPKRFKMNDVSAFLKLQIFTGKGSEISDMVSCIHVVRDGRIVKSASKALPEKNSRFDFMYSAMAPQAF